METEAAAGIWRHAERLAGLRSTLSPACTDVGPRHWQALRLSLLQGVALWALAGPSGILQPLCLAGEAVPGVPPG